MYKSKLKIYTLVSAPNGKKAKEATTEVAVTASVEPSPNKNNIQDQTSLNKKKLSSYARNVHVLRHTLWNIIEHYVVQL